MKKYIFYCATIASALAIMMVAINVHDHNVFMTGYQKHKNEMLALNQATIETAQQQSTLQRMADARRINAEQQAARDRAEWYENIQREVAANDKKHPDKYPDHWRLTADDLQLLNRAIAGPPGDSKKLGASTRIRSEYSLANCSTTSDRRPHQRTQGFDPRMLKAVLFKSWPAPVINRSSTRAANSYTT